MSNESRPNETNDPPVEQLESVRKIKLAIFWILGGLFAAVLIVAAGIVLTNHDKNADLACYRELIQVLDDVREERAKASPDFTAIKQRASVSGKKVANIMKQL